MARKRTLRSAFILALIALAAMATPAIPAEPQQPYPSRSAMQIDAGTRFLPLGIGKSTVIELPRDAKEVLVADPTIANAIVRSARRAFLIGVKVGQTNIFFFDAQGQQIAAFDIAVTRDLNTIRAALRQVLPKADIKVEGLGEHSVVISGTVDTPHDAQVAYELAVRLLSQAPGTISTYSSTLGGAAGTSSGTTTTNANGGGDSPVVNALVIRGRDQVMIKVTVAEVQRDVIKQLGVNLNGSLNYGTGVVNFNTDNPFTASTQPISSTAIAASGALVPNPADLLTPNDITSGRLVPRISATIRAMERAGVMRTLAEPSLTAISGESASFLAGGEFPVPGSINCENGICQRSIQFKKFGVGLAFTPVVLSEGRISIKVMTEVSELSNEGAIVIDTLNIPSLRVRRSDTTVELPSGGSLAMAGLIQEQTKQQINGLPGLAQVPVLGSLFRSRDYLNRQTELMILVTPYVVRAVAQKELSRPDDGYVDASDPATVLLGRLNRIYGTTGKVGQPREYRGNYGFILD